MRVAKVFKVAGAIIVGIFVGGSAALFAASDNLQITIPVPVRLSYSSSWVHAGQKHLPKICLSVWPDGHYRVLRKNQDGQSQLLQGTLPAEQLKRLRSLLEAPDFRALSGTRGGLVREGSESFIAEVPREGSIQRLVWMIPDRESRFSKPVADIVSWIEDFQPIGAEVLLRTDFPDVCPQVGGLKPLVASNSGFTIHDSCTVSGKEARSLR